MSPVPDMARLCRLLTGWPPGGAELLLGTVSGRSHPLPRAACFRLCPKAR